MCTKRILSVLVVMAALWLGGCAPDAPDAPAAPSKENELRKDLADALRKQNAAEAALAAAKAEEEQKLAIAARKIAELQAKVDDF